jgi:hypothetical protein
VQDFIQKEATLPQLARVVEIIEEHFHTLMCDTYGNYFC